MAERARKLPFLPKSGAKSKQDAARVLKRARSLWDKRASVFDPQWQMISQYFVPEQSDINTEKTESTEDWFDRIYETTAIRAASTCSVGVRNWVTPSTDPWLGLAPPRSIRDRAQAKMNSVGAARINRLRDPATQGPDQGADEATAWCGQAADDATSALSNCNFYSVIQPFNRGACAFGTALMFCEEGRGEILRFEQFKVGTFVICENDQKQVDTVFRWLKITHRQAEQKFGEENLPKRVREMLKKGKEDETAKYVHGVFPNLEYDEEKGPQEGNWPITSLYIAEEEKHVCEDSGYHEMPYFALRWSRWGSEDQVYGCSPAFECLADARQLNYITQYGDALVELMAYPRFLYPDNLSGEVQLAPGGITTVKSDDMARGVVPKEWMTSGRIDALEAMKEEKRKAIQEAFFVDIFTMLGQLADKRMTAMEVAQRVGEKLDQFTGTFDQYVTDLIIPLVRRVLGIMIRGGHIAQPPQSMFVPASEDPKAPLVMAAPQPVINSRVTLSIKALRNVGVQKTVEVLAPLAEQQPQIWDNFDLDEFTRMVARDNGVSEKVIRSVKDMMAVRQYRIQKDQEQRALEAAQALGKAGAGLGKSPAFMQQQAQQALESQSQPQAAAA